MGPTTTGGTSRRVVYFGVVFLGVKDYRRIWWRKRKREAR